MQDFEKDYAVLVDRILITGEKRQTRNGVTASLFGMSLHVPVGDVFPLIQGRKMFPAGVLGEFAAFIRGPKTVYDFEKWGCNYWKKWADEDGHLAIDYGNAWFNFNGKNQIAELKEKLTHNNTDRRMIISSWRPEALERLSLPCCHYSYQFYVREDKYLDMIWTQRSVDMMIGMPSDIILGAIWLITLANEFGYIPGEIKFDLGDCHIYEEHFVGAEQYVNNVEQHNFKPVEYYLGMSAWQPFEEFEPSHLALDNYEHCNPIKFLLKE